MTRYGGIILPIKGVAMNILGLSAVLLFCSAIHAVELKKVETPYLSKIKREQITQVLEQYFNAKVEFVSFVIEQKQRGPSITENFMYIASENKIGKVSFATEPLVSKYSLKKKECLSDIFSQSIIKIGGESFIINETEILSSHPVDRESCQ